MGWHIPNGSRTDDPKNRLPRLTHQYSFFFLFSFSLIKVCLLIRLENFIIRVFDFIWSVDLYPKSDFFGREEFRNFSESFHDLVKLTRKNKAAESKKMN